jgi:hypothetical protein
LKKELTRIEKAKIVFTEIMEKRDFSWIDVLFSDSYGIREGKEYTDQKISRGTGKIGIRLYLNTFINAFANVKYTFLNILESEKEKQVVIRWKIEAKHVNDIFSIKATNKFVSVVGVSWFFFDKNDLIRFIQLIWNGFSIIDQLDLEIRPKKYD